MQVRYVRLFTRSDGASCFEDREAGLEAGFAVPPAEPLYSARLSSAEVVFWIGGSATWKGDVPHPAPRRMIFVTVQGEYQIEASDGAMRKFPVGRVLLIEDITGAGHVTKVTSTEDAIILAVGLPAA
ncbi:MAG: hypothetical protein U1E53_33885 [Dongiaceae bacterium]